jgi:hypothetical protein
MLVAPARHADAGGLARRRAAAVGATSSGAVSSSPSGQRTRPEKSSRTTSASRLPPEVDWRPLRPGVKRGAQVAVLVHHAERLAILARFEGQPARAAARRRRGWRGSGSRAPAGGRARRSPRSIRMLEEETAVVRPSKATSLRSDGIGRIDHDRMRRPALSSAAASDSPTRPSAKDDDVRRGALLLCHGSRM